VDQPPLAVLLARATDLFGVNPTAIRILPALAASAVVVHVGNTTPYDLLAWTVVTACAATALLRDRPRWWLGAGVAAGIGIEDEYLILTLLAALVIGVLVTRASRPRPSSRVPTRRPARLTRNQPRSNLHEHAFHPPGSRPDALSTRPARRPGRLRRAARIFRRRRPRCHWRQTQEPLQ
jgi:hypothetical protein